MADKDVKAPERVSKADEPEAPPVEEYPKALYHADGSTKTVATKDEEAAAKKDGYQDAPIGPAEPRGKAS